MIGGAQDFTGALRRETYPSQARETSLLSLLSMSAGWKDLLEARAMGVWVCLHPPQRRQQELRHMKHDRGQRA